MSKDSLLSLVGKTLPKKDPLDAIIGEVIITGAKHVQNLAGVVLTLDGKEESVYYMSYSQATKLVNGEKE